MGRRREVWLLIPGFPDYEVSDRGRVRNARTLRLLKPQPNRKRHPYYRVKLGRARMYVHVAVLEAFEGPRWTGEDALHLNDDTSDNRLDNLKWGPISANRHNRTSFGRRVA